MAQQLNDCEEVKVNKQVLVSFSFGKHKDEACVMWHECMWDIFFQGNHGKLDGHIIHDGYTNRYSFVLNKILITLVTLSPGQVYDDQVQLNKESDLKKESESSKSPRT